MTTDPNPARQVAHRLTENGRTLAEKYASYAAKILPAGASEIQRRETRIAFWAGAASAIELVDAATMTADDLAGETESIARLADLHAELEAFAWEFFTAAAPPRKD